MKKPIYNPDGTKQIVSTGWKEFDRQTNCLTAGNAFCNTQYSMSIRPWKQTNCDSLTFPEGKLMARDLSYYSRFRIPEKIEKLLKDKNRDESVTLYMFFTLNRDKHVQPFCWAVTDRSHNLLDKQVVFAHRQNWRKRLNAANEALQYISNL